MLCREDVSNNLTLAVAPDDFKDESQLDASDFLIRGIIGKLNPVLTLSSETKPLELNPMLSWLT